MEKNLEKSSLLTSRESVAGDRLLTFDEIPSWQKYVNSILQLLYRDVETDFVLEIVHTSIRDTVNIHSHSIGSIIFAIILPLHFYFALYRNTPAAQPIDAAVFLLYFAGVASCFAVSAAFHTAGSHSQAVHKKYNRADCCGIVLLMWGASLASIHFAFICDARLESLHWFLSSASATGCITFILGPLFIQPAYRNLRALTYLSLGLFAIVFILHGIYLHGFALQRRRLSLEWMGLMALLNFLGCAAYAFRIPESKFPGKFDFVGASHQIMHVAVLAAGLLENAHGRGISMNLQILWLVDDLQQIKSHTDKADLALTVHSRDLALEHYELCSVAYRDDGNREQFLKDLRVMVNQKKPKVSSKASAVKQDAVGSPDTRTTYSQPTNAAVVKSLTSLPSPNPTKDNPKPDLAGKVLPAVTMTLSKSEANISTATDRNNQDRQPKASVGDSKAGLSEEDPTAVPETEPALVSSIKESPRSTLNAEDLASGHAGNDKDQECVLEHSRLDSPQTRSSTPSIEGYKVGWICALPFEAAAAEVMLDEQYPELPLNPHDSTLYTLGRVGSHNVVIACLPRGRPGLSAATAVARGMLEKFRSIKFGFMVGIGGGVPSNKDDIRLGDVVVSQPNLEHGGVVQYDLGKAEGDGRFLRTGHLNNPPTLLLSVLNRVQINHERGRRTYPIHMAQYAEEDMEEYTLPHNERDVLFDATYPHTGGIDCANCDIDKIIKRRERNTKNTTVKIHYGTIASGNQVIKDAKTRDRIVKDLGGQVLCFEMEAAGLMNDFPCLVIRGISDYCDSHKNDGWQRYAAASAAAYTRELLLSIPSEDMVE
ncbi:purine and uridine phosphorylase, partial [Aureobasidium melanogenum]